MKELALMLPCGFCWSKRFAPCTPEGQHYERYVRAYRRGLLTILELREMTVAIGFVTAGAIVLDEKVGCRSHQTVSKRHLYTMHLMSHTRVVQRHKSPP
jgi:hypothetical protein